MIELTVLEYLKRELAVPVRMEIPANPPGRFVVVEKTGASCINRLDTATIAVQSYAESLVEAAKLNEVVKAAMDNMITLDRVSAVSLNSDYNFTNTATKKYRYQAIFVITYLRKD